MNKTFPLLYVIACSVMATPQSEAAAIRFDGGPSGMGTDYNTGANWEGDLIPFVTGDRAFVDKLGVDLNSAVLGSADDLIVGITTAGSLTLNSGSSVSYTGAASIGFNAAGSLTINGGTFNSSAIGVGAYTDAGFGGALNMNGGIINTGTLQTTFDSATINLTGGTINLSNGINFNAVAPYDGTNVNWDFTSGSSTTINVNANLLLLRDADFSFDLTGLGAGNYTLINNNGTGTPLHTGGAIFNNLSSGLAASINSSGNISGDDFVLTIATIPEPSSVMLVFLGLLTFMRRRR